jgi:hypothetical protein
MIAYFHVVKQAPERPAHRLPRTEFSSSEGPSFAEVVVRPKGSL